MQVNLPGVAKEAFVIVSRSVKVLVIVVLSVSSTPAVVIMSCFINWETKG